MREGWRRGTLADLVELDITKVRVEEGSEYPLVGVFGFGRGLLHRDAVTTSTTKYKELNVVRPYQLIYSKLKAFEGAITVVPAGSAPAFASPEFPTYTCLKTVLPEYLHLLTQHPSLWSGLAAQSKGVGGRRERLNPQDLLTVRVSYPGPAAQRRIVNLVGSLDRAIAAAAQVANSAHEALVRLRDESMVGDELWVPTTFGEVADRSIGRTPPRNQPSYWTKDTTERPFCTIASLKDPRVRECTEGVTEEAEREGVAKRVPAGSLLLSFKLSLGRTAVPATDVFPNEAIAWVRPREGVDQEFLQHSLARVDWDSLGSRAVMGKTLNKESLNAIPLLLPPIDVQLRVVEQLRAVFSVVTAAERTRDGLSAVRANLLTALLSGEHEIPESYDKLLAG
ncbi:hypothetical protein [Janibacter cremeus]|uniref:Type I restriction modification DNA specificity domain-containing protein n=1 Tax=Janibacter cremeus TaxID=1285192 RepID=A0A852VTK5_9MICO|nr:hypothetical protein [Janibacter cremeus]NYF99676.1 hypothetical protein [Janibacter cremeus]